MMPYTYKFDMNDIQRRNSTFRQLEGARTPVSRKNFIVQPIPEGALPDFEHGTGKHFNKFQFVVEE